MRRRSVDGRPALPAGRPWCVCGPGGVVRSVVVGVGRGCEGEAGGVVDAVLGRDRFAGVGVGAVGGEDLGGAEGAGPGVAAGSSRGLCRGPRRRWRHGRWGRWWCGRRGRRGCAGRSRRRGPCRRRGSRIRRAGAGRRRGRWRGGPPGGAGLRPRRSRRGGGCLAEGGQELLEGLGGAGEGGVAEVFAAVRAGAGAGQEAGGVVPGRLAAASSTSNGSSWVSGSPW